MYVRTYVYAYIHARITHVAHGVTKIITRASKIRARRPYNMRERNKRASSTRITCVYWMFMCPQESQVFVVYRPIFLPKSLKISSAKCSFRSFRVANSPPPPLSLPLFVYSDWKSCTIKVICLAAHTSTTRVSIMLSLYFANAFSKNPPLCVYFAVSIFVTVIVALFFFSFFLFVEDRLDSTELDSLLLIPTSRVMFVRKLLLTFLRGFYFFRAKELATFRYRS